MTPDRVFAVAWEVMEPPLVYGVVDCCRAPCTVFRHLWGVDLWPGFEYRTLRGALRKVRDAGGARALCDHLTGSVGLREGRDVGAIGLLQPEIGHDASICLGICIEPGKWMTKAHDGVLVTDRVAVAWVA